MNEMIERQLDHRTIRFFEDKAVEPELVAVLMDVMNRTATSNGMQTMSVIRVSDQAKKDAIAAVGKQAYIAKAPELFIFVVDSYRLTQVAKAKGVSDPVQFKTMDQFFQGAADSYLSAQNMANAVEALGLGCVFLGSILNDSAELIKILDLPPLTFPLLGLAFGYSDDSPQLKPRMGVNLKVGENGYPYQEDYLQALSEYDKEMTHYYDTRENNKRSDSYTNQVEKRAEMVLPKRANIMKVIEAQGFILSIDEDE